MKNRIFATPKVAILILILSLLFTSTAYSTLYYFQGYDNEKLTVTTSAVVQFTQSKLNPGGSNKTTRAYCTVETNDIRYWYDEGSAGAPTTTTGIIVLAGKSFEVIGYENINILGMIGITGTSTINVQYETLRTLE